ncbi:nicotinamidase [Seminavis robusta]|uniref:nicotinamidase n=1 Tax=Seminavis robusta TaxID=568900 RepID=A0A9N8H6V1_9STRA|nr:nicotinamidase [Seminavis robusta]|eukprot:Sro122_g059360.1 nicotinamidase (333) ;mRNA; f:110290-111288
MGAVAIAAIIAVTVAVTTSASGDDRTGTTTEGSTATEASGSSKTGTALILGAMQDCFMEDSVSSTGKNGTLRVEGTASVIDVINEIRQERGCLFDVVVRSEDDHPRHHISFASTHGLPPFAHTLGKLGLPIMCRDFQGRASCCPTYWVEGPESQNCDRVLCPDSSNMTEDARERVLASPACELCLDDINNRCFSTRQQMWPDHCVQNEESGIPPSLYTTDGDIVLKRGDNPYVDAYSAFADNTNRIPTPLHAILEQLEIHTLYLVGVATDFGILYTATHARNRGYNVVVVLDATRHINDASYEAAIQQMEEEGSTVVYAKDVLAMECPDGAN